MRRKIYPRIDDCHSSPSQTQWFKNCHLFDGTLAKGTDSGGNTIYHYNLGFAPNDLKEAFELYYYDRRIGHALPPIGSSSGLIETYQDQVDWCAEWVREHIDMFCKVNRDKYLRLVDTLGFEYDPIKNYDMKEEKNQVNGEETFTHTPTVHGVQDIIESSSATIENVDHSVFPNEKQQVFVQDWDDEGSDSITSTILTGPKTEHYSTTYDDAGQGRLQSYDIQSQGSTEDSSRFQPRATEVVSLGQTYEDVKSREDDSYELTRSGNIGVTTTQQMIESEREVARFNLLKEFFEELNNYILLSIWG